MSDAMLVYLQREYNLNNPDNNYYNTLPERNQGWPDVLPNAYDGRYLAEFNFGYNGSENFEKGSRYGFFLHSLSAILSPTRNSSNH